MQTPALERVKRAAQKLVYTHPHFFAMLAKITWAEDSTIETFCVDRALKIRFNPTFALGLPGDQLIGVIAHECLHPLLDHYERALSLGLVAGNKVVRPDLFKFWAYACDMAINASLKEFGLKLPDFVLYPPKEYTGPVSSEAIYQWLREQAKNQKEKQQNQSGQGQSGSPSQGADGSDSSHESQDSGQTETGEGSYGSSEKAPSDAQPKVGAGCYPIPSDADGEDTDVAPMTPEMREIGEQLRAGIKEEIKAGRQEWAKRALRGSGPLAQLMERTPSRTDWKQILTSAVSQLSRSNRRDLETFSRRNRRSPLQGVQFPGHRGLDPMIAVVIDCSSSMDREWIKAIIGHCEKLTIQYPGTKIYLATHTTHVTWEGWIKPGTSALPTLYKATAFGGGTIATPAYEAIANVKAKFDYLIHFTDTEIERPWPKCPARKLVVGAYGSGAISPYSQPPEGARVLPCREG